MGKVGPPEVLQINRPQLSPEALGARQFRPGPKSPEELRPALGKTLLSDNVIEKKLPLVFLVRNRRTVYIQILPSAISWATRAV